MKSKKGLIFVGVGFELGAVVIGSMYVGKAVDEHYQLGGLGVASFVILAFVGWFFHFIILLKKIMNSKENHEDA